MKNFQFYLDEFKEVGYVAGISHFIARVNGLPSVQLNEFVVFESGVLGQVLSLDREYVEVLVFSQQVPRVGSRIARTNESIHFPVGDALLGGAVDVFGNYLSGLSSAASLERRPIYVRPGGIAVRKRISKSFETGVGFVDLSVPLGKGQRELVIGDRKTGKTSFLLQTILNQAKLGTICVYAAIGKKQQDIKRIEEFFKRNGISALTVIVASVSDSAAGVIYLTPYAAMTLAEYFRDKGNNVLLVFDDLVTHAKFYREIALLAGRFPGRNSYPGDMFYTHAQLLERAGNFRVGEAEVSITCLAVAETTQGDLSGYIQTNLMSMTDGHIFFDVDLFTQGRKPAVNPFLSVSRVGKQVQPPLMRDINRELSSFLSYFEKMKNYSHLSGELRKNYRDVMETGERVVHFFIQPSSLIIPPPLQVFTFGLLWYGWWREKSLSLMTSEIGKMISAYQSEGQFGKQVVEFLSNVFTLNDLLREFEVKKTKLVEMLSPVLAKESS